MTQVLNNSLLTNLYKYELANGVFHTIATGNVYIGIGQENPYSSNDTLIPVPNQSTDYMNGIWRAMIALKKIQAADTAFVVPRIDWQSGVTYAMWDNQVDMYSTVVLNQITGTINTNNSRAVTGQNTVFLSQVSQGNLIYVPGDDINVAAQILQVTDIFSNTSLNTNTAFSGNIVQNSVFTLSNTFPAYASSFYVKNSYDQVFICLQNNGHVPSTVMPVLAVGGDLPTDVFIITADGYKWKYLYSIPSGQKLKFLSDNFMPVYTDPTTSAFAQQNFDQSIDIVLVENPGFGYNQNVPSNTAQIITVEGDGTGADIVASVNANGSITGITVLNGGRGYTQANLVLSSGATGQNGVLRAIIGPVGGHGFNPPAELGATALQITAQIGVGQDNNFIPTQPQEGGGVFEYRQISLVDSPLLSNVQQGQSAFASNLNYSTVYTISVQPLPGSQFFMIDETVYQSPGTIAEATFSASVVFWDALNSEIWVNNIVGQFTPSSPIVGTFQTSPVTAFTITPPQIAWFTGEILYINNIEPVVRGPNQIEYVRILLQA